MSFVPAPQPVGSASTRVIDDDVACVHCGYNLRGLASRGVCPECGQSYGGLSSESRIRGSAIEKMPAAALRRVIRGCMVVLLGWTVLMGWLACRLFGVEALLTGPMVVGGTVVLVLGLRMLAPSGFVLRGDAAWKTPTGAAMWCVLAGGGLSLLVETARLAGWSGSAVSWLNVLDVLVWFAGQCFLCIRLRDLAADAADDVLAARLWSLMWASVFVGPFGVFSAAVLLHYNLLACMSLVIFPLFLIITQFAFVLFVFLLARNYQWAIRYQATAAGRDRRLRERMERERRGEAG